MIGLIASAGAQEMLLVWFGLMTIGVLAIGLVLREGVKSDERVDPSIHQLRDPRDLPLVAVRDALRPKRRPTPPSEATLERRHQRRRRAPRNPDGPRLVK